MLVLGLDLVEAPGSGERFVREDVRVRIGLKETEPPRPVCYCFGHTVEEIEAGVASTSTSVYEEQLRLYV